MRQAATPGAVFQADDAWSYVCGKCGACCRGRDFIVTAYDIGRLAEGLGVSPMQVAARFVEPTRPALKTDQDGWCQFYKHGVGCRVHPHRPAVCRFYPLGRRSDETGAVAYVEAEPQPHSTGLYGRHASIRAYLQTQGAEPYERAIELIDAFLNDAFGAAHARGLLAEIDRLLQVINAGAGPAIPVQFLGVDALSDAPGDALQRLRAHLDALRAYCGVTAPNGDETYDARLVQVTALFSAGLGVAPGFSSAGGAPT